MQQRQGHLGAEPDQLLFRGPRRSRTSSILRFGGIAGSVPEPDRAGSTRPRGMLSGKRGVLAFAISRDACSFGFRLQRQLDQAADGFGAAGSFLGRFGVDRCKHFFRQTDSRRGWPRSGPKRIGKETET
jgi:hypothetical protein